MGGLLTTPQVVPTFSSAATTAKKKTDFFAYLRPHIDRVNATVLEDREQLQQLIAKQGDLNFLDQFFLRRLRLLYLGRDGDPQDLQALLKKIDVIPSALALIQAAKESGWGASRFARDGYNFFGQQCFIQGCGFTPKRRAQGRRHEVAKFRSTEDAVRAYVHNLNTHPRYQGFRAQRAAMRSAGQPLKGGQLAASLDSYSERGDAYIAEIQAMIRNNDLE